MLLAQAEILEKDGYGIKVIRLLGGNFLKTFWFRHKISSRKIYSESLRFLLHERALKRRSIPTVTILKRIRIPHLNRTGIIYRPLKGRTLRQVAAANEFNAALARQLGEFIAELHRKGILFRSLHFGNIVLCSNGTFGLIDISNMNVFPFPLRTYARRRNFDHFLRYKDDLNYLTNAGLQNFIDGYSNNPSTAQLQSIITQAIERWNIS